jgi:methionyl-tRNA formyltransferase
MNNSGAQKITFFGTPQFAVTILKELKTAGIVPALVITAPDKPQGRGLVMTPPPVKVWAKENKIKVIQPETLKENPVNANEKTTQTSPLAELTNQPWDLFIVAAYGKIIPENILEIPKYKTLNVHPSLLPKLRGASPIESTILNDDQETGVTIMRLDKEMDHGPIVAQEKIPTEKIEIWPIPAPTLENILAHQGGALLAKILPDWTTGKIAEKEQNHTDATYCQKITKADGLINLADNPYKNYLKICAYSGWPGSYFFAERSGKKIRVSIKEATYKDDLLQILRVIPEGKKEMPYNDFLRGLKN